MQKRKTLHYIICRTKIIMLIMIIIRDRKLKKMEELYLEYKNIKKIIY